MTSRRAVVVAEFLVLLAFWFALSRRFEPLFIVLGVVTAAGVTALGQRLSAATHSSGDLRVSAGDLVRLAPRAVGFAVWLTGRAVVAGAQVAWLALSPRLEMTPCVLRFRTELHSSVARTVFTNAISLVPGTLTVDLDGADVVVHALSPGAVDDLISGQLQNRVARFTGEAPQPPVDASLVEMGGVP